MKLHDLFAGILEPPKLSLIDQVNECVSILSPSQREAAGLMNQFKTFVDQTPLRRVGEIYADTFDFHGGCYPFVGYYLFRSGERRRTFLAGLEELYQMYDFSASDQLPDNLGIMLRFLARVGDEEEREEMTFLYILPALKRMLKGFGDRTSPYEGVLQALLLVLQEWQGEQGDRASAVTRAQELRQE